MALIVEDGTIVAGANSYVSLAEADNYFENHPYYSANWSELSDEQKEAFLTYATRSADTLFRWKGYPVSLAQNLGWPRTAAYDKYGLEYLSTAIPNGIKLGIMEMAVSAASADVYAPSSSAGLEEVKIDVIELKFDMTPSTQLVPTYALSLMRDFGVYGAGSRVIKAIPG